MNTIKMPMNKFLDIKFDKFLSKDYGKKCKIFKVMKEYLQLSKLIQHKYELHKQEEILLTKKKTPFIIGINGSISSGKSYYALLISDILRCFNPGKNIATLSTDNFIYSNKHLVKKKLFSQKGYPKSYNWKLLFKTLNKITKNESVKTPVYCQASSDIKVCKGAIIKKDVDILLIEGINILKPTCTKNFDRYLLSDYLDYSIYIYVGETILRKWFYKRLLEKRKVWKKNGTRKKLTKITKGKFHKFSNHIWTKYNKKNLEKFIRPYKYRADIIIHKNKNHNMSTIEFIL